MPPGGSLNPSDAGNASGHNEASSSRAPNDPDTPKGDPITCSICKATVNPEPNDTCGICYEPFSACSLLHPCHHIFDYECIFEWLTTLFNSDEWTPANTTCPLCRGIIDTIERTNPIQSLAIEELFRGSRDREGAQPSRPIAIDNRGRERYLQLLYHRRQAGLRATGIRPYTGDSQGRRSRSPSVRRARVRRRHSPDLLFNYDEDEYNYGGVGPSNNDSSDWVNGAVQESPEDDINADIQEADYTYEDVLEDVENMELLLVLEREILWRTGGESDQSNGESSRTSGTPTTTLHQGIDALINASVAFPPHVPPYVAPVLSAPTSSSPGNAARHVVPSTSHLTLTERFAERRRNREQAVIDEIVSSVPSSSSSRNTAPNAYQIPRRPVTTTLAPNVVTRATAERRNNLVQAMLDTYTPAPIPSPTRNTIPHTRFIPPRLPVAIVPLSPAVPARDAAGPSTFREQTPAADAVVSADEADRGAAAYGAFRSMSEQRRTRRRDHRD